MLFTLLIIGFTCGLRSMTGPAVVCWAAHLGWLHLDGTRLAFLHHPASLIVFTLCALGELVADKLPFIPRRTMAGPLVVRILSGALCGCAIGLSAGTVSALLAGALGGVGAIAGTFAGYHLRRWLTGSRGLPDLPIAMAEDVVAIGLGVFAVAGGGSVIIFSGFL